MCVCVCVYIYIYIYIYIYLNHFAVHLKLRQYCKSTILQFFKKFKKILSGTSLVVQWLRIHLPMQGTWVRSLVGELRSHMPWGNEAHMSPLLSPHALEPACHNERSCVKKKKKKKDPACRN